VSVSDNYYNLPFPNDIRTQTGRLDLSGFAQPGPLLPELGDPVGDLLALAEGASGFATSSSVFFQLTHTPDWDTATPGITMGIVDLTPGPTFGEAHPVSMSGSASRRQYICANWAAVTPIAGRPLRPGHTYGAYLTNGVQRDGDRVPLQRDDDLGELLASTPPSDASLRSGWEIYAPFRDWSAVDGIASDSVAAATVFTVHDPLQPLLDLIDAVHDAPVATLEDLHTCDGTPGPWDDGAGRGCGPISDRYVEIQGTLSLPQFREGSPPYRTPDDDGRVEDRPVFAAVEAVPFVLTVPVGDMPAEGWPIVVYSHGPGEDSRAMVRDGLAERWSAVDLSARSRVGFAVLSLDGVLQGGRIALPDPAWLDIDPRGGDPDRLQLNRTNTRAFRGNALQAVADLASLGRWVTIQAWARQESPTGEALRFDADHIVAAGHDSGAWTATTWTVADPRPSALVVSNTTGSLPTLVAESAHPFDLGAMTQVAWADVEVDRDQVLLTLEAIRFDLVDPMTWYDRVQFDAPIAPRHVLHVVGRGGAVDDDLQEAAGRLLHARLRRNGHPTIGGMIEVEGSLGPDGSGITAGTVLSDRGDSAFFADSTVARQVDIFLATSVVDSAPTIPE
jgi:hypothetical protein